ncbi:disease resistance protein RPM1-like [Mercurialis annua]|uniref:disease resistance protein RPM1-like n=1 Tax=Mercurialis annua TaxID=3986 RepID=UPI00215F817F|nr:disease resistance protein RPM1-like [Mercurialis annua]XP_050208649.1 disease resistance protein RPM1-like [Mercurialis annua]XP_050208650.1 disease resistance protein RPM1-like [Mercurialis annua]XP_050208651.1 disease resistance protein RPM1-like [Mercurialis annua]
MAEGSVVFFLTKLTEFLQKEGSLLSVVREEAEYISDELEFMKAFLRVAETIEDSDLQLKVFAKKVRYLVFDLEDALDDFRLRIPSDNGYGFRASLQKISNLIKSLKARRHIALKMQRIKLRVIGISETHRRYLIRNNIMEQGSSSSSERQLSKRKDALQLEEANPVGIEHPKKMLIEWLFEDRFDREVVSVVGMGGLGKTTLVTRVYHNKEVKKRFEFRAWITLSQSFTTEDLLKDIILQLFYFLRLSDPQGVDNMDNDRLRTVINEFLQERRYLVVLDNVSNAKAWYDFENVLPNNSCGSRILLTTRNHDVALASSPDKAYNLSPLSQEESWTLFCRKIFQNEPCPPHLEGVLRKILVRCQGLPLAIVAIGGVLATKDRWRIDEWELVHRSLGAVLEDNDRLRSILSLSYNDLPYYLKYCLMYFSIFPADDSIEHARLVRLWIAEGFVKEKEGMTLEEVAEGYLNELIKRSLVQVVDTTTDGRVKTCRVHDILLEMIILKSRDQDFAAIANEQSVTMMWPEKVRRLSIHNVMPSIQEMLTASRPRSLLMFWWLDSLPESFVLNLSSHRLRLLNVLDLEGAPLTKFPNEVVSLYLLKYLSLRNTKVTSIPSSIGKLQNLESLDLKHTHVTELPTEILKLQKLRHLLAYRYENESDDQIDTKYGCKAPAQIGSLQSLQKLCFLEANQGNNLLTELGKLNQLRRLGIVKLRREDGETLCSSIGRLRNLRALSICSVEEREIIDIENLLSPPRFLQRLYLSGRLERLPEWISSLDSLVKVVLKWSGLTNDPLLLLQHLPNLVHLEFVQVYDGETLCFQAKGFQRLKFLGLNRLDRLNKIMIEQGAMPNLEKLIVQSCRSLLRVPLGIESLNDLKILEFYNMPLDLIMALHPNGGEDGDYWKVERVPEVFFTYWYDGNWDIISLESFKGKNSADSGPSIMQRPRHIWK